MRKLFLCLLLLQCSFVTVDAQNNSTPINWFWDNFIQHLSYPTDLYRNVRLISVSNCEITLSCNDQGVNKEITFAVKYIYLNEYGTIKRKGNYESVVDVANNKKDFAAIHAFGIKKESIPLIEEKLKLLTANCNDTYDYWKTKEQAVDWLATKLKKYAYTQSALNEKSVMDPKLVAVNDCEIVFSYNLVTGGRWEEKKVVGTATEKIPMNMDRISTRLYNFQNEAEKIVREDKSIGEVQKTANSVIKIAYGEENLYERILKAMHFLYQNCEN
jgi:hypothetical protein